MAVQNTGNAAVFFDQAVSSTTSDNLIQAQVDPSQPQVQGLVSVTSPLVPDRHLSKRLAAFDPDQFDLSPSSVLVRFLTALLAGAGIGGMRKQQTIARMGAVLAGTNFVELDGFWGAIFFLTRLPEEALPSTNDSDSPLNPSTDVADSVTWDAAQARDGRYRSRIEQLAKGFALGATYDGVVTAAQAILNSEVEIVESWLLADYDSDNTSGITGNTWQAIALQYGTYGNLDNVSWGTLALGNVSSDNTVQAPLGNRGEVVIIPGRVITESERYQLHLVLDKLIPAGMMATVVDTPFVIEQPVGCRSVAADSVDWDVVSSVAEQQGINTGGIDLYPDATDYEGARPALSSYTGERWTLNSRVASVSAYAEDAFGAQVATTDYQAVTYSDGTVHNYAPGDALVDSRQLALARATSEGVATVFPYDTGRFAS